MIERSAFHKEISARIPHYQAALGHSDYVYMASDSALCDAGKYLRTIVLQSIKILSTPVVMVKPGFEDMCVELNCNQPCQPSADVKEVDPCDGASISPRIRSCLFDLYQRSVDWNSESKYRKVHMRSLSVMMGPASVWDDHGRFTMLDDYYWDGVAEKLAIQQTVLSKYKTCTQIIISQDLEFLKALRALCPADGNFRSFLTLSLNENGYLYDPFEAEEDENALLARIATNKLTNLVTKQPLFIEDSALKHPQAAEMLHNIKAALLNAGKQMIVLANKKEPLPFSDILMTRAQETPATVRFAWVKSGASKADAIIETLLQETASMTDGHVILVTDRVKRAENIQTRLAGTKVQLDIYSVNKHGFLSKRASATDGLARRDSVNSVDSASAQIEQAVKSDNRAAIARLLAPHASDKATIKTGIITCLCEGKTDTLKYILQLTDRVPGTVINWWILEFRQFQSPSYFLEYPEHYDLLLQVMEKCILFSVNQIERLLEKLHELNEETFAAHTELEYLISLFNHARTHSGPEPHGLTHIRRHMFAKEPPRSPLNEEHLMQAKLREIEHKSQQIMSQLEQLQNELCELKQQELEICKKLSESAH